MNPKDIIENSAKVIQDCATHAELVEQITQKICQAFSEQRKILLAGNGGSAAEATHIAAEFVGKFNMERKGLPAISLAADLSAITSIGNDYGFEKIFSRQIEALGNRGDIFIALTTSGNSENLIEAVATAKKMGLIVICLLGKGGGKLKGQGYLEIVVGSNNTAHIQEAHLVLLHSVCELVDAKLFK